MLKLNLCSRLGTTVAEVHVGLWLTPMLSQSVIAVEVDVVLMLEPNLGWRLSHGWF